MPRKPIKKPSKLITEFEKRRQALKKVKRKQRRIARVKKQLRKGL